MPTGTRLYAARAGKCSAVGYGYLALRATGSAESDWYVHIDRSVVHEGQVVAKGALVAYSGNKVPGGGSSTGPHLHFERNTAWLNVPPALDPMPLLNPAFEAGGGTLTADMTPEEHVWLQNIHAEVGVPITSGGVADLLLKRTAALLAQGNAPSAPAAPGGAVDLAPVLAAIAAIQKDLAAVKAVTDGLKAI
jgi:murein DD-endopeptidase MepM/ murein hydrolase activator NlpD